MAPTKQQKAFCAVEYAKTVSVITVQRNFRRQFEVDPPDKNSIKRWHTQLMETGCLCKGKSTGHCLCVAYAKAKAPDVVFAYSTTQNAFCCLVGAILNILCPRERRVFQSKLRVSSSNQCNLHHSPHTGHLEKINKKRVQSFSDTVYYHINCDKISLNILLVWKYSSEGSPWFRRLVNNTTLTCEVLTIFR